MNPVPALWRSARQFAIGVLGIVVISWVTWPLPVVRLLIRQTIIEQHGGRLSAANDAPGTSFHFTV